jgi:hypothetical protein
MKFLTGLQSSIIIIIKHNYFFITHIYVTQNSKGVSLKSYIVLIIN